VLTELRQRCVEALALIGGIETLSTGCNGFPVAWLSSFSAMQDILAPAWKILKPGNFCFRTSIRDAPRRTGRNLEQ
jgi:hypothetical protein